MRALQALAVVEGVIIVLLLANKTTISIKPELRQIAAVQSPLDQALEYESPLEKFEQLVKENSGWIPHRSAITDLPILATCAIMRLTNHARILIAHGADVSKTLGILEERSMKDAMQVLRSVALESGQK